MLTDHETGGEIIIRSEAIVSIRDRRLPNRWREQRNQRDSIAPTGGAAPGRLNRVTPMDPIDWEDEEWPRMQRGTEVALYQANNVHVSETPADIRALLALMNETVIGPAEAA